MSHRHDRFISKNNLIGANLETVAYKKSKIACHTFNETF